MNEIKKPKISKKFIVFSIISNILLLIISLIFIFIENEKNIFSIVGIITFVLWIISTMFLFTGWKQKDADEIKKYINDEDNNQKIENEI